MVLVHRKHQNAHIRLSRANLPGRLDAVEPGHRDVHQNQLRLKLQGNIDRLPAIGRFPYDRHLG